MDFFRPPHLDRSFLFPDAPDANIPIYSITNKHKVRIAASLDSLSGTASLMGKHSRKVLSTITLNRVCRKCDMGISKDIHDCRLNFHGTAKAMEPHAAVQLTKNNEILSSQNVEIGVIITDNDSSAFAAMRNGLNYEIIKQADKNHTSKGVRSALWKIQSKFKELNTASIQYLAKCFNYSVS